MGLKISSSRTRARTRCAWPRRPSPSFSRTLLVRRTPVRALALGTAIVRNMATAAPSEYTPHRLDHGAPGARSRLESVRNLRQEHNGQRKVLLCGALARLVRELGVLRNTFAINEADGERKLRLLAALVGRELEKFKRTTSVLGDAVTFQVQAAHLILRTRVTLLDQRLEQAKGAERMFRAALFCMHRGQTRPRLVAPLLCGLFEERHRTAVVLWRAASFAIHFAKEELSILESPRRPTGGTRAAACPKSSSTPSPRSQIRARLCSAVREPDCS